jgi:hypothetical protein
MSWVKFALGLIFAVLSLFWLLSVLLKIFTLRSRKDGRIGFDSSWLLSLGFAVIMLVLSLAALITSF